MKNEPCFLSEEYIWGLQRVYYHLLIWEAERETAKENGEFPRLTFLVLERKF